MKEESSAKTRARSRRMARFFDKGLLDVGQFLDFDPEERIGAVQALDLSGVDAGHRVFEPGCGAGRFTEMLAERVGMRGLIEACEIAPAMLKACRGRGLPPWVRIHDGTALRAPVEAGTFDFIFCLNLWPHLPGLKAHLERFSSLLRPTGQLIVAHTICRESVNAIHDFILPHGLCERRLPPADVLAAELARRGWRPLKAIDKEVYLVSAKPPKHTA